VNTRTVTLNNCANQMPCIQALNALIVLLKRMMAAQQGKNRLKQPLH